MFIGTRNNSHNRKEIQYKFEDAKKASMRSEFRIPSSSEWNGKNKNKLFHKTIFYSPVAILF